MVKRLISANTSEIMAMSTEELKQSIWASDGRVIVSENIVTRETFIGDVTNAEIAKAFGADMILLNGLDVLEPFVFALDLEGGTVVEKLHHLVGCPIGVNLEPIDLDADMTEEALKIETGRQATAEAFKKIETDGYDFVCLTGNPATGVSNSQIIAAIKLAKAHFSGIVIAGKMHSSGVNEPVVTLVDVQKFLAAGADIILAPAVGTVPGFDEADMKAIVKEVHKQGGLVLSAMGTSQESSDEATVREIAIRNKICGVDMHHIGDSGYGGLAPVENIFALSKAIRGQRHAVSRMARSINR
ncbi:MULTISPECIES: DUF7916 family protein [unclassified Jeotgalibaca]|uniref:DUF7916 family protein n=1 Tax=unclassified Jeotgalibaca TaxID=2621505 RepID=UPI003FD21497